MAGRAAARAAARTAAGRANQARAEAPNRPAIVDRRRDLVEQRRSGTRTARPMSGGAGAGRQQVARPVVPSPGEPRQHERADGPGQEHQAAQPEHGQDQVGLELGPLPRRGLDHLVDELVLATTRATISRRTQGDDAGESQVSRQATLTGAGTARGRPARRLGPAGRPQAAAAGDGLETGRSRTRTWPAAGRRSPVERSSRRGCGGGPLGRTVPGPGSAGCSGGRGRSRPASSGGRRRPGATCRADRLADRPAGEPVARRAGPQRHGRRDDERTQQAAGQRRGTVDRIGTASDAQRDPRAPVPLEHEDAEHRGRRRAHGRDHQPDPDGRQRLGDG